MSDLSSKTERKFTERVSMPDFMSVEVMTETGYEPVTESNKTIPYDVYHVVCDDGNYIECADTHILITKDGSEVYAIDSLGYQIRNDTGDFSTVVDVIKTNRCESMYDLSIDSNEHTYYTNGLLSHNTAALSADCAHCVLFKEDYKIGITSYKDKNVLDFMDRIRFIYENLPWELKAATILYNRKTMKFDNDSSIVAEVTSENTFRGNTLDKIISDELAFVKPAIAKEFKASLMPSLEGNGENSTTKFVVISTPNGTSGAFPDIWFNAVSKQNSFYPIEVKYEEIPGRNEEFERRMVAAIGRDKFDQEYKNAFIGSGGTLIRSRVLEEIECKEPIEEYDDIYFYSNDIKGRNIAFACDVSEGVGGDYHCIQIVNLDTMEQIGEFADNTMSQSVYFNKIKQVVRLLKSRGASEIYYTVEANSIGQGILRLIESSTDDQLQDCIFICDVNDYNERKNLGIKMTMASKPAACWELKDLIELGKLKIYSRQLLNELKFFVSKGNSFSAEKGMHDDRVMAMVIFTAMLPHIANFEESVDDVINNVDETEELWGIC